MNEYLTLPFSPLDLVQVYTNKSKVLKVDLHNSTNNIPIKQLLVYIANTKFEVEFNDVSDELLVEYMTTNFNLKSAQLDDIVMRAIQGVVDIPSIRDQVTDIRKIIKAIPNYVLDNIETYSEGNIVADKPDFNYVEEPLSIGYNAIKLIKGCQLLLVDILQKDGVDENIYTFYMNDKPKYDGNDFYYYLYTNDFIPTVLTVVQSLIKENPND